MALNTNEQQEAYRVGAQFRIAKNAGLLTDTNVAAANTVAGLTSAVGLATLAAGFPEGVRERTEKAISIGASLLLLTDALIAPLTTVDGLIALTGIPDSYKTRAFYD